ncbi:MAG: minichromosome maintenance protein MCM [Candidatus Anstonellales archaeon]
MEELEQKLEEFLRTHYQQDIDTAVSSYPNEKSIYVDYKKLERFEPELADLLIKNPDKVIEAGEAVLQRLTFISPVVKEVKLHLRFRNAPGEDMLIEGIKAKNIGEMIAFKGVVTRRGEVLYRIKLATFQCKLCDNEIRLEVTKSFVQPKKCPSCHKMALEPVEEKSTYTDIQRAEVQELVERVRGGTPSAKIELQLIDDLVNKVVPGENIIVNGVLRLKPLAKGPTLTYTKYVEVSSVTSTKREFEEIELTKEDEKRIRELSKVPNIESRIAQSIAPVIFGHDEVKYAIALMLFGGTKGKLLPGGMKARDDVHILLIGDPGIAKTRFLESVNKIAPKSIYVSGKSVSGVGLTASAERDELSEGGWTLKAGALVLASGGIVTIDEFDKIDENERAALHEVMETQTVSVAKAGMVTRFGAKTGILAAANPKYGRFDQTKNIADQFNIPPSLLSRFDLIFPIFDVLDEEKDARLADHILGTHMRSLKGEEQQAAGAIDPELLRKYIAYARKSISPRLTEAAANKIKDFYIELRKMGMSSGSVPITPRYIEGLIRLAEANAKMRLSEEVEERDAEVAIRLVHDVMKKVMTDQATGRIDSDIIATGAPRSFIEKIEKVEDIIEKLSKEKGGAKREEIVQEGERQGITPREVERFISELSRKGVIYEKSPGFFAITEGG